MNNDDTVDVADDDDDDCHLALDVVELAVLLLDLGAHAHRHVGEVAQDAEDDDDDFVDDDGDDQGRYKDKLHIGRDDVYKAASDVVMAEMENVPTESSTFQGLQDSAPSRPLENRW